MAKIVVEQLSELSLLTAADNPHCYQGKNGKNAAATKWVKFDLDNCTNKHCKCTIIIT